MMVIPVIICNIIVIPNKKPKFQKEKVEDEKLGISKALSSGA